MVKSESEIGNTSDNAQKPQGNEKWGSKSE